VSGACTCRHVRSDHRNGSGRCMRPGCPCLFGPPPARRLTVPQARAAGVGHTDASGIVQDFKRIARESERTKLERMLWRKIDEAGLREPIKEHRFAAALGRQFRADGFYPPDLLIEVEGGIWSANPGRHNRGSGFQTDAEKYNLAAILGLRVLRFTERMIKDGTAVDHIRRALEARGATHQLALTGGNTADATNAHAQA
jgi:very-short-patch-repair endonuclease